MKVRSLVRISMLGVMSFLVMYLEFPILPAAPFLKYDASDLIPLLGGSMMGPAAAVLVEIVKVFIFFLSGKGDAGLLGSAANLLTGLSFIMIPTYIYYRSRRVSHLVFGLVLGTASMVLVMTLLNAYVLLPLYGIQSAAIWPLIKTTVIPFNLIKGSITGVLAVILFKFTPINRMIAEWQM